MVKQIIKRIIILNIVFAFLMTLYRLIFTFYYGDASALACHGDLAKAFVLGIRYDCAVIAYMNTLVTLSFITLYFVNSKKIFLKFINLLKYYYTFMFGIVMTILCIDFGFYSYFQSHINILIFGVFEDDTAALFSTIVDNYPVVLVAIGFICLYALIFILSKKILEKNLAGFYLMKSNVVTKIVVSVVLLAVNFMVLRGSFGLFPLGIDNAEVSNNVFINKVAINAIYTFQSALEARMNEKQTDYIAKMGYSKNNIAQAFADFLDKDVSAIDSTKPEISLVKTTKYNKTLEQVKPNVIFIMMEALGTDLMHYNSDKFNILGEFKKHLEQDTVFYKFIPGNMGTIGSLESAIINIARLPSSGFLCQSEYSFNKYFFSGPVPYKKNGYETIFMYGGNAGWRNCSTYMPNLFFDKVYGEGSMPAENERSQWGVYDEYLFDFIFDKLQENPEHSKFIYALTTSNHPPYSLPKNYKKGSLVIDGQLDKDITGDRTLADMRFAVYQYSCQKVGEFLTKFKDSKYADNTIIAITGDHNFWSIFSYPVERELDCESVPFYLYIPKKLMPENIDTSVVGSHTDILATLYNLSLSNTQYWSQGTDLLSPEAQQNIASNSLGIIITKDDAVLYNYETGRDKTYKWNTSNPREFIISPKTTEHEKMLRHYKSSVAISYYMLINKNNIIENLGGKQNESSHYRRCRVYRFKYC